MLASISILFHDQQVRDSLRVNSLNEIKTEDFPFAALLVYVDILQDDRRDMTSSSSRPDILRNVEIVEGSKIIARLEENVLTEGMKRKLFLELEEALSFFIMNGFTFIIPEELGTNENQNKE
jgi:hypothetical protein